jgi:hypothetical protein
LLQPWSLGALVERSAHAQTMTPPVSSVRCFDSFSSLHPDVLHLERVISLALDRIDGVDSDSFGASAKLPRSAPEKYGVT